MASQKLLKWFAARISPVLTDMLGVVRVFCNMNGCGTAAMVTGAQSEAKSGEKSDEW